MGINVPAFNRSFPEWNRATQVLLVATQDLVLSVSIGRLVDKAVSVSIRISRGIMTSARESVFDLWLDFFG